MRMWKDGGRGFTLIELLVVIAIIGIIAAIGVPALTGARKKAARKEAMSNILSIAGLLDKFYADGNFGYNDGKGTCTGGGSASKVYCNAACGETCAGGNSLKMRASATVDDLVIQGDNYKYTVTATDSADTDSLCESYTITATGCTGKLGAGQTLSLTSTGAKTGVWQ